MTILVFAQMVDYLIIKKTRYVINRELLVVNYVIVILEIIFLNYIEIIDLVNKQTSLNSERVLII